MEDIRAQGQQIDGAVPPDIGELHKEDARGCAQRAGGRLFMVERGRRRYEGRIGGDGIAARGRRIEKRPQPVMEVVSHPGAGQQQRSGIDLDMHSSEVSG